MTSSSLVVIFLAGLAMVVLGDLWLTVAGLMRRLRLEAPRRKILGDPSDGPEGEELTLGLRQWLQLLGLAAFFLTVRATVDDASALPVPDLLVAAGYIVLLAILFLGPCHLAAAVGDRCAGPLARWVDARWVDRRDPDKDPDPDALRPRSAETTGRVVLGAGFMISACAVLPPMNLPAFVGIFLGLVFLQLRLQERRKYLRRIEAEETIDAQDRSAR